MSSGTFSKYKEGPCFYGFSWTPFTSLKTWKASGLKSRKEGHKTGFNVVQKYTISLTDRYKAQKAC